MEPYTIEGQERRKAKEKETESQKELGEGGSEEPEEEDSELEKGVDKREEKVTDSPAKPAPQDSGAPSPTQPQQKES